VWALAATDVVAGLAAAAAILAVAGADELGHIPVEALALGACWAVVVALAHGYNRSRIGLGSDEVRSVIHATVGALAVTGFLAALIHVEWLRALIVAVPIAALLSVAGRYTLRKVLHRRRSDGRGVRSVVLVGSRDAVIALARRFDSERHFGMRTVAAIVSSDQDVTAVRDAGIPAIPGVEDVAAVVRDFGADAVAVTSGTEPGYLRSLGWALERSNVELLVDPGLMEVAGPRLHIRRFEGLPLLYVEEPRFSGWTRFFKSVTDRVFAALLVIFGAPLWLAVSIAIKLDDGGPVFFRQVRIGKDGRPFTMWKFRSMACDAETHRVVLQGENQGAGPLFKLKDDPRVTRVGAVIRKYSIDELPQLINVLTGSMSLVGPRPPLPSEVEQYERPAHRRLLVTPGLTGLWQINGRSDLSWEESIRLDLRYVENWTFAGDLLILWKTLFAVLGRRGAY
jgi:exopolysaccharide biosynthesis polyprenyl glycosylphosphotransferase